MSQSSSKVNHPLVLELDSGKYFWCACGNSGKQPFCDGSHNKKTELGLILKDYKK